MISYQTYKILHLFSLFVFLPSAILLLKDPSVKFHKMLSGIASFGMLTGGMGLMARLGGGFQPWIIAKLVLLLALTGFVHVAAKRFPHASKKTMIIFIAGICAAAALAVYKPGF